MRTPQNETEIIAMAKEFKAGDLYDKVDTFSVATYKGMVDLKKVDTESFGSGFIINQEKADEHRERFLLIFKKTTLRIRDEKRGNPIYLIRYSLFTCPWFAIKLHRIKLSDDDCLHDHPWSFITFILSGGYIEESPNLDGLTNYYGYYKDAVAKATIRNPRIKKFYRPGSVLWRPAPSVHRLELPEGKTATTLVITLRKKYDWGFYTPSGWKFWKDYIRSGSKCE